MKVVRSGCEAPLTEQGPKHKNGLLDQKSTTPKVLKHGEQASSTRAAGAHHRGLRHTHIPDIEVPQNTGKRWPPRTHLGLKPRSNQLGSPYLLLEWPRIGADDGSAQSEPVWGGWSPPSGPPGTAGAGARLASVRRCSATTLAKFRVA
eukprot:SAG22_NODE_550_length_9202_cov_30.666484_11_plen_148_part_00